MGKRCVVTGIGIVSPVGTGKEKFWGSRVEGKSGISEITYVDTSNLPVHYAGEVKDFDASEYIGEDRLSVTGRYVHFAVGAVQMALADAGISPKDKRLVSSLAGDVRSAADFPAFAYKVFKKRLSKLTGISPSPRGAFKGDPIKVVPKNTNVTQPVNVQFQ